MMMRLRRSHSRLHLSRERGFTLIEVLVALVVTLVGLMGAAGLMVRTVKQETESFQRLQALNLLQDMVDQINANRIAAGCYSAGATGRLLGFDASGDPIAGADISVSGGTNCPAAGASNTALVGEDLVDWNSSLQGAAEQSASGNNVGAMIGARGCVVQVDAAQQVYRVTVAWQGLSATVAPAAENTCGINMYGVDDASTAGVDERELYRRIVTAIVRIGDLE